MFLFLDTSALVKAYVLERGTEAVHEQLRRADEIAISVLAVVEFCAALSRKVREGALTSAQRNDLTGDLLLDARAFVVLPVPALGTDLIQTTLRLIVNEGLRGPDALQLASALRVSQGWSVETLFCCADDALLRAATRLGLPSWNPEQAG